MTKAMMKVKGMMKANVTGMQRSKRNEKKKMTWKG